MNKRVCMFVWNHFTNDARVLRECTALSEAGYYVDLICIHDPNDSNLEKFEQINEKFCVQRVDRYPEFLMSLQRIYRTLLKHKLLAVLAFLLWIFVTVQIPLLMIPITVFLIAALKTRFKAVIIRGSILLRMIKRGYRGNYDIYHSNDLNTLLQGYICSKLRLQRKKLIYDSHEVQTSRTGYDSPAYGHLERFLIKKIDSMIVENHTRAKYNEELYGFYPHVVHNYPFKSKQTTEKIDIHNLLGIDPAEKILLYQGGIQVGRGLDKLIQAAPYFKEGILVLIGDGKIKPELINMVEELHLQDKVKFIPKVPLKELPKYTRNAYLGFQVLNNICFNHYSASSNKLFEYMMAGVPVVACDFPEIKRVVEGERTGICIDSHSPEEIASAVNKLIVNTNLYNEFSRNSQMASSKYNWDLEKGNFLKYYEFLLAN